MRWFIYTTVSLFSFTAVCYLAYLFKGKYPRERRSCPVGEDVFVLLINIGFILWGVYLLWS